MGTLNWCLVHRTIAGFSLKESLGTPEICAALEELNQFIIVSFYFLLHKINSFFKFKFTSFQWPQIRFIATLAESSLNSAILICLIVSR